MANWGRLIDGHVTQVVDVEPETLFTAEECANWVLLPEGQYIGSYFHDGVWQTGAEHLEQHLLENPPGDIEPPAAPETHPGAVLAIEITNPGANYAIESDTANQYDIAPVEGEETGRYLVLRVTTGEEGEVVNVTIENPGINYKVGDKILYKDNYGITWRKSNPTYAEFTVTSVQE